jgi:hypothetical protein
VTLSESVEFADPTLNEWFRDADRTDQ